MPSLANFCWCLCNELNSSVFTIWNWRLKQVHIVWKLLKISHLNFSILAFSTIFCPIKTDLSGNTVGPQASVFQTLAKLDHFWHFQLTFVHSKYKHSSLRSQCWMRLFLWFSNTVHMKQVCGWACISKTLWLMPWIFQSLGNWKEIGLLQSQNQSCGQKKKSKAIKG